MRQAYHRRLAIIARLRRSGTVLTVSLVLAIATGCSSSEQPGDRRVGQANNRPPVIIAASILPSPVVLSSPLAVRVDAQDPDEQNIVFRYQWLINGQAAAGQTNATLPAKMLRRGDRVAVEVTPSDGMAEGGAFRTSALSVVNTPPVIQHASIEADPATQGRHLLVHAEIVDPDHDHFTVTYRWKRNGETIQEGESDKLNVTGLSAMDMIEVEVVASDGAPNGVSSLSGRFKLANSPPTIVSTPPSATGNGHYAYQVQSTDADGDPVTYALETAPPGMSIDAATGQMRWTIPSDMRGVYRIRVVAQDDRGGFAAQEFELFLVPPPAQQTRQTERS